MGKQREKSLLENRWNNIEILLSEQDQRKESAYSVLDVLLATIIGSRRLKITSDLRKLACWFWNIQ